MKKLNRKDYLSTEELAKKWDMASATLKNWRYHGKGPKYYKLGAYRSAEVLYKKSDIRKYEESHFNIHYIVETSES